MRELLDTDNSIFPIHIKTKKWVGHKYSVIVNNQSIVDCSHQTNFETLLLFSKVLIQVVTQERFQQKVQMTKSQVRGQGPSLTDSNTLANGDTVESVSTNNSTCYETFFFFNKCGKNWFLLFISD